MGSVIAILGGVGVVYAAGMGVNVAMKWFHTYEYDFSKKSREAKGKTGSSRPMRPGMGGAHSDSLKRVSKELQQRG